jgi:dephospho-CoA kinase
VIGLVGGVAAGKSTAAREFARLGAAVVDGDAIGHELLGAPGVERAIRRRWGAGVFARAERGLPVRGRADSPRRAAAVDRAALGRIVFADPRELAALDRILHPRIRREMKRQIAAARGKACVPAVVVDAAVLFEAGWDDLCTAVVFVDSPACDRARRAAAGKGWDRASWRRREIAQISLDKKRQKSDYIIDNSSGVSRLREQVRQILLKIVHAADRP